VPKFDLSAVPSIASTGYPPPFNKDVEGRLAQRLTKVSGLEDFGVNIVTLLPGAWSSQRHWHEDEDEFLIMLQGEATLVEDKGEALMRAGDCAVFLKGVPNGHHLINRSDAPAKFFVVGARGLGGDCHYPDIDLFAAKTGEYRRKDGTPYDTQPASKL
jgi:uncharacterized cupin superfamily protein